jgi:predicted 3-demethylubiquinone-9 3-methyltransferase (glyoxalase superfamily)
MEKIQTISQKITPFLWFDTNAEEAAIFYTSVFKNSGIDQIEYYPEGSPAPAGSVMTVSFHLEEQKFIGLNAGPAFKFTEAISFMVNCETQEELDFFWEKLCEGGKEIECGWLKDKFGLSWQIVPAQLFEMMKSKDPQKSARMLHALWKMKKLDIAKLKEAYDG